MARFKPRRKKKQNNIEVRDSKDEKQFIKIVGISVVVLLILLFVMYRSFS